jgi:transposase
MGWKVEKIAIYCKWTTETVRKTIHKWKQLGLVGLMDRAKTGRKRTWTEEDIEEIEQKLDTEQRAYSSRQLCNYLASERKVNLSERHLRRILKKKICLEKNKKVTERKARF